jgi:hypothetical protein
MKLLGGALGNARSAAAPLDVLDESRRPGTAIKMISAAKETLAPVNFTSPE